MRGGVLALGPLAASLASEANAAPTTAPGTYATRKISS